MTSLFYDLERREALDGCDVVDLFGGPGGWEEALHQLGIEAVGVEFDRWACATRRAAGHRTVEADVSHCDPADHAPARGVIASPPCQAFSTAGKQHGRRHVDALLAAIAAQDWRARPARDPRVWLVLEVGRWVEWLMPEWVALEQVPAVLPLWEAYAALLDGWGYSTWCGVLNAADYGVPQIRKRAVLMASRTRAVAAPRPTHSSDGGELAKWVTMGAALGWTSGSVGFPRADDVGTSPDGYRERDWRDVDEPSFVVTEKARSWTVNTGRDWKPDGDRSTAQTIDADAQPSPTLLGKSGGQWLLNPGMTESQPNRRLYDVETEPAPTIAFGHDAAGWAFERPATTICGDPRAFSPGGHVANDGRDNSRMVGRSDNAIKLEPWQALVLQGFRRDYPVRGVRSKRFEQIGNAIPPPLARAILAELLTKPEQASR